MKTIRTFLCYTIAAAMTLLFTAACGDSEQGGASAGTGKISVQTIPDGASVFVRGTRQTGHTPKEFGPVSVGTYLMRIEKDGYMPQWVKVDVKKNKTASVQVRLNQATASVLVTSKPDGAMVSVDGKEMGPTPCILTNLKFGSYDVSVARENFKAETKKLIVPLEAHMPDSPFEFRFNLMSDTGTLKVVTEPEGAEIYIDGEKVASETPAVLESLDEGKHKIKVVKKGFAPVEDTVSITRDKVTEAPVYKLKPLPGSLLLEVSPSDALVTLNGERVNEPGKERDLAPGSYELKVSKKGYDDDVRTVKITAEEVTQERIELTRKTGEVCFSVNPPGVSISIDGQMVGMSQPDPQNPKESRQFRILGIAMGSHTLTFTHPYSRKALTQKFEIKTKGQTVDLQRLELWVPNADIEVLKTKRIYRNGKIIETGAGSDEIIYMENPNVRDTYKRDEVKITYLPQREVSDPKFKSSMFDLLNDIKESDLENEKKEPEKVQDALLRFRNLPAGSEVFLNGKSCGKATDAVFEIRTAPGQYSIRISHKYGVNTKNPSSNAVSFKNPLELAAGAEREIGAPPILWVADHDLYLNNGKVFKRCRIPSDDGSSAKLTVETEPGKTIEVNRSEIAKKNPLK